MKSFKKIHPCPGLCLLSPLHATPCQGFWFNWPGVISYPRYFFKVAQGIVMSSQHSSHWTHWSSPPPRLGTKRGPRVRQARCPGHKIHSQGCMSPADCAEAPWELGLPSSQAPWAHNPRRHPLSGSGKCRPILVWTYLHRVYVLGTSLALLQAHTCTDPSGQAINYPIKNTSTASCVWGLPCSASSSKETLVLKWIQVNNADHMH